MVGAHSDDRVARLVVDVVIEEDVLPVGLVVREPERLARARGVAVGLPVIVVVLDGARATARLPRAL